MHCWKSKYYMYTRNKITQLVHGREHRKTEKSLELNYIEGAFCLNLNTLMETVCMVCMTISFNNKVERNGHDWVFKFS